MNIGQIVSAAIGGIIAGGIVYGAERFGHYWYGDEEIAPLPAPKRKPVKKGKKKPVHKAKKSL